MPYVKKARKAIKRAVRKRYIKKKSGAVKITQVMRDLALVKRQLNVEHKHLDFKFGSGQTVSAQFPTKSVPIILALPVPARGTAYNQRIGNQLRVVHMTTKLQFVFENNTDLIQRASVRAQVLFAKSGDDVPDITKLYDLDANGHYTPMSFVNTQEYSKYVWIKSLDHKKGYTQPTSRYPLSRFDAKTDDPANQNNEITVTDPASTSLNIATFYSNKQTKLSIHMMFQNGSDTVVEQMVPYLLLRSDVIDATIDYDPIAVSGTIRMTYVDN